MRAVTVAICRDCWEQGEGFYLPVVEAGSYCDNEHDGKMRKLTKRRLYICDREWCEENGYITLVGLRQHQQRDHEAWEEPDTAPAEGAER